MSAPAYVSHVRIVRKRGRERPAELPAGETVAFGVHGAVAEHYGRKPGEFPDHATTIDHVIGAAAG